MNLNFFKKTFSHRCKEYSLIKKRKQTFLLIPCTSIYFFHFFFLLFILYIKKLFFRLIKLDDFKRYTTATKQKNSKTYEGRTPNILLCKHDYPYTLHFKYRAMMEHFSFNGEWISILNIRFTSLNLREGTIFQEYRKSLPALYNIRL